MMMPGAPAGIALPMAVVWVVVSPSVEPAETVRSTPSLAASAFALFSMEMKYGLVKSLRIRATRTLVLPDELLLDGPLDVELLELHAARAMPAAAPRTASRAHRDRGMRPA